MLIIKQEHTDAKSLIVFCSAQFTALVLKMQVFCHIFCNILQQCAMFNFFGIITSPSIGCNLPTTRQNQNASYHLSLKPWLQNRVVCLELLCLLVVVSCRTQLAILQTTTIRPTHSTPSTSSIPTKTVAGGGA